MRSDRIIDLFSGPGGWCEGARSLGLRPVGIEVDRWACATRAAAGHLTIRADVEAVRLNHLDPVAGLIASPPCQAFSAAGKGDGRRLSAELAEAAAAGRQRPDLAVGVRLVLEPLRWVEALRPRWVALEQVPSVLPIWQGYRSWLRSLGYSAWCGILNAADYGVPQTRRRAVLVASLDRTAACPPPTHAKHPGLFGELPWVSMADALGWDGLLDRRQRSDGRPVRLVPSAEPAPTLTAIAGSKSQWLFQGWTSASPAPTVTGGGASSGGVEVFGNAATRSAIVAAGGTSNITLRDALVLQSFTPDYPVRGNRADRYVQIGNAVPPRMAGHVLSAASGCVREVAA